jgi:hypothetical protein
MKPKSGPATTASIRSHPKYNMTPASAMSPKNMNTTTDMQIPGHRAIVRTPSSKHCGIQERAGQCGGVHTPSRGSSRSATPGIVSSSCPPASQVSLGKRTVNSPPCHNPALARRAGLSARAAGAWRYARTVVPRPGRPEPESSARSLIGLAGLTIASALVALTAAAAPLVASHAQYRDTRYRRRDPIEAAIFNEPGLEISEVQVETVKGVQLTGFVTHTQTSRLQCRWQVQSAVSNRSPMTCNSSSV